MLREDARSHVGAAISSHDAAYPLVRFADDDSIVGFQAERPISRREFLSDVAALAPLLPAQRHVVNLCVDRYRFMVGLGAALQRDQITLMPPNDTPAVLTGLAKDYGGVYALVDTARPPLPALVFPERLEPRPDAETKAVPTIPGDRLAVTLFTSGSTGHPKPVQKTWGVLVRSALSAGERLGIKDFTRGAVIGTVPHQHSYGFESVMLLAMQHGLSVVAERRFYPADILAAVAAAPRPRVLVTTPVHLRALVAHGTVMPPVDLIVSATAPLPATLAKQAEECFVAPLLEIYGCTEAGQIATRRTVNDTQWQCLEGVVLHRHDGASWVDGPAVPSATPIQDVIEQTSRDTFRLAGRSAELVDIAGKHTTLAHLNLQLLAIEGVKDGSFVMPEFDENRVNRLAAVVVAPGMGSEAILRALRQRIDAAFLPRPLILLDALPRNSLGKLPREAVLQLLRQNRIA